MMYDDVCHRKGVRKLVFAKAVLIEPDSIAQYESKFAAHMARALAAFYDLRMRDGIEVGGWVCVSCTDAGWLIAVGRSTTSGDASARQHYDASRIRWPASSTRSDYAHRGRAGQQERHVERCGVAGGGWCC
jgi:hypothetical protein